MLLSARNIKNGFIDLTEDVDFIPQSEFDRIRRRCEPTRGDILISCSGTIGRVTTVRVDEPFALVRSVALVRPNRDKMYSTYLEHYLRSEAVQRELHRSSNKSSQANLFTGPLKAIPVLVPPLDLQRRFTDWVEASDIVHAKRLHAMRESKELHDSLVQRAFRGEL
jgi:type I restriction enzyme S subunit